MSRGMLHDPLGRNGSRGGGTIGTTRLGTDLGTDEERSGLKTLEVRRHARRDPAADRLSVAGRAQAEDVGRELAVTFDVVFVSPAQRAAETVAWMLRGVGSQLPPHAVIPGLAGQDNDGTPLAMAGVLSALLDAVPEGGRGLAISHTPLIERGVLGLAARELETLGECEGVALTKADEESAIEIEEIRLRSR